jgi:hypothetical protein
VSDCAAPEGRAAVAANEADNVAASKLDIILFMIFYLSVALSLVEFQRFKSELVPRHNKKPAEAGLLFALMQISQKPQDDDDWYRDSEEPE